MCQAMPGKVVRWLDREPLFAHSFHRAVMLPVAIRVRNVRIVTLGVSVLGTQGS